MARRSSRQRSLASNAHRTGVDGGDHVVFLGRVERFTADDTASPLVFHRGRYSTVAVRPGVVGQPALPVGWPLSIHY